MQHSSSNSNKEPKPEDNVQKLLERNRVKTQALKKLLKFIEEKELADGKPANNSLSTDSNKLKT
jgi:hypothetical protein